MSAKVKDDQGRFRNKVIAFRVSPEENEVLNTMVQISGHTKQDYLIACITQNSLIIEGNSYVYRSLRRYLAEFINRFDKISLLDDLTLDEVIILEKILSIMIALKENKKTQIKSNNEGAPEK